MGMCYREAALDEVAELRYMVLRAGRPRAEAEFVGDDTARHFAVFECADAGEEGDERVVCCLTMMKHACVGHRTKRAWQLRGMACAVTYQGQGLGRALLTYMESELGTSAALLWCYSRAYARDFYERSGWSVESDLLDLDIYRGAEGVQDAPSLGWHYKMVKYL